MLARRRRGNAADGVPALEPGHESTSTEPGPPSGGSRWTFGPQLLTAVVAAGLWLALAAGVAGFVLVLWFTPATSSPPPAAPPPEAADRRSADTVVVGEFAERYVTVWLTTARGDEAALAPFLTTGWRGVRLPAAAATVAHPSAAAAKYLVDGLWSVTVGVDVTEPAPADDEPVEETPTEPTPPLAVRRYFQVPVVLTDQGALTAQTLPTPVPPPPSAEPVRVTYRTDLATGSAPAQTAADFLAALLTGAGGLDRYTTPDTVLADLDPPPYVAVQVRSVVADLPAGQPGEAAPTDGDQLRLLVTAAVTTAAGQDLEVAYPLSLLARGGRWEVVGIDPAPELDLPDTATPAPPADPSAQPERTTQP